MKEYSEHYEDIVAVKASPEAVFAYADDHSNFSSHMNQSSWMMGRGSMRTETDEGKGQRVGSHIRMIGTVFGINLFLDEVVTKHQSPQSETWETVGDINLIVIDQYKLGFEITPRGDAANLRVFIDYNFPKSWRTRWLGHLLGGMYAKWCVEQMATGTQKNFESSNRSS